MLYAVCCILYSLRFLCSKKLLEEVDSNFIRNRILICHLQELLDSRKLLKLNNQTEKSLFHLSAVNTPGSNSQLSSAHPIFKKRLHDLSVYLLGHEKSVQRLS